MTEHTIENFMKLATNHTRELDKESRGDGYYRRVYEKLSTGRRVSWNWAAFSGCILWLLYRKMYLASIVISILSIIYNVLLVLLIPSKEVLKNYEGIFFIAFVILFLCPFFLLGAFSNWLYVRHIHKKIDKGYHLCDLKNTDGITPFLFFIISVFGLIPGFIIAMNDKRKVRKTLSNRKTPI